MDRLFVISGCSGGGKSTLLKALASRQFHVVLEPGRRIVQEELENEGSALPWIDPIAFASRALEMAKTDYEAAKELTGPVFFDRSAIDAASFLAQMEPEHQLADLLGETQYAKTMFMAPPWPENYAQDSERRHDFAVAKTEYSNLCRDYSALGHNIQMLPKVSVEDRVSFVMTALRLI